MADGTQEFKALGDGTYESTVQDGSLTIVTSYDENFEITGTEVQKAYENVQVLDDMPDKFKDAWQRAEDYLPASWASGAIQFAQEGTQILVIATADDPSDAAAFVNGDVIGRITSWDNTGTWTRWFDDQEFDVEGSDWSYNYHSEDWTYFANSGGREVNLIGLTDALGNPIANQLDEVGHHVSAVAHKSLMPADEWAALQSEVGASDDMLTRLGTDWNSVNYIQVQDNNWSAVVNDYRDADDLYEDGEERIELHGFASGDSTDTVFLGAITKREGFIVLRDEQWNEVARLMDPSASSEDTSYDAMVEKYGETFSGMWQALETVLPATLSAPEDLLYVEDQHNDVLVFNASGEMVARLNHWDHSNTWDRSWDTEYPSQTWTNSNFEVQVREGSAGGHWLSLGRFESGQSDLTNSDGVTETEHSWERTSSTLYERESGTDDWAALEAEYFSSIVSDNISGISSWDDVDRIEISDNSSIYYPVAWRDQIETEESSEVRFYEEVSMDSGNWYRQKFLGSMEKRDGFIEIRNENWETVARVVDVSDTSNLKDWDFISNQYEGIEDAWDNAVLFFPDVPTAFDGAGAPTAWGDSPLQTPENLLFTTDDNTIYAFTAAGVMAAQVNHWVNEDQWERFYDDQLLTVKNIHFNYSFHDADWNQIANSGGNQRYIIDPDDGSEILDEVGKNIGFMQTKDAVDPTLWATYDPSDASGTIDFSKVSEIRYETRSWNSVTNKYRDSDDNWSDSNVQIQYYEEVTDGAGNVRDWPEFTGSVEQRDGFIEIRDEHWRIVSKKVDGGETYLQMVTRYGSDFDTAWAKLEASLPTEWTTADSGGVKAYEGFKFTTDKWDNILIFDNTGEMVGQINYWSHVDQWSRSWDEDYPSQIHTNSNFHFQGMDTDAVTGNWHWVSIGEYQVGQDELVKPDGTTTVLERSWENVGQTMFARLTEGDDPSGAWNTTIKDTYFIDAVASNLSGIADWTAVDRIDVSSNTYTHQAVGWRDAVEVEESVQVRFYEEVAMDGGNWYHTMFLGSMEKRDGFVEIRNENWETVARIADIGGSEMMDWVQLQAAVDGNGSALYPEIADAWSAVTAFFPDVAATDSGGTVAWNDNPLKAPDSLVFTTDEENIYAFTSNGEMVGQINFWSDEHEHTRFYRIDDTNNAGNQIDVAKTVKNINYNYNFHDADWNNVANSGGNARYIVEDDDSLILDEIGNNIGFMQRKDDVDPSHWATYDPSDDTGTIDWSKVVEIRYETNSYRSVSDNNPYRSASEDWDDSNVTIQYYEQVDGQNWTQFVGSKQMRDGFIEIRDEHWDVVSKKVDASLGKTYNQMLTEFGSDLDTAWTALEANLPVELQDPANLTFTKDQWDNILIFGSTGEMIGQINYWSHTQEHDRSWDDIYPKEIYSDSNFHFQGIETQADGNWHWVSIGHYGMGERILIDASGAQVDDNSWVNVGSTMFERSSPNTWDSTIKTAYYVDAVADSLESVGDWTDIDRIEVSQNTYTHSADPSWRDAEETNTSLQVRFYEEVAMDGGNWYHNKFLGTMEKRDGFIEIRDDNWNTVSRVVDPDSASAFSDIAARFPHLEWAWDQVEQYLPAEAVDPSVLSFTEDDYNIYAFDAAGNMVVQINSWSWTHDFTDSLGILREEESYDYRFQDAEWNDFASARKSQEFISDTNEPNNAAKTDVLDREHTGGSFRVRKEDVTEQEWASYDPDDKTGTIIWDDIVEISIGVNSWQTFENFDRPADGTYSDSEERVEYFELVVNDWGDSWPDRVGVIETQGTLQKVYDKHWELVGSQTDGDIPAVSLMSLFDAQDIELIAQFRDIIGRYIDLDTAEFIEGAAGEPGLLVQNGQIMASAYYEEEFENGGTQLYWDIDFRDLNDQHIIDVGGWNEVATPNDADTILAKPNGVKVREYFYKDRLSPEEWNALEQEASFTFSGFDWGDVGVLTKKVWKNDWNNEGYETRTEYKFVKVDPMSGRQDWNYFRTEIEDGGVTKVMDGDGTLLGYDYPAGSAPVTLTAEMGSEFQSLIDALNGHLYTHQFYNTDIPPFSAGEFKVIGNSVTWTQNDGVSQLSIFGDFEYDKTPNEWGDKEFEMKFDRQDGNPLVRLKGWVSVDENGNADYDHAEIRIEEYVYKTDLESTSDPKAENTEWSIVMTEFGPSDTFKAQMGTIWDGTAPDVELVEIQYKFKYRDGELQGFDPNTDSVNYFPDEVEIQFMEGSIDSTDDLDIEWTGNLDYRIEFSGGVAALTQNDTLISMELDTQTTTLGTPTPTALVANTSLFADNAAGTKLMAAVDTLFGSKLAAAIPNYSTGELQFSGDNVLLVASDDSIIARGDLYTDLTPDDWGNISFGVNFEGNDGHNSIGFNVWSAMDSNGKMDFTSYGIHLEEYYYKSKMTTTDAWDAVKDQYGPHPGLAIYDPQDTSRSWDDIELVQVQTRYRDLSEEVDASALAPNYQRTEARFVEGQVHHDGDLDLYYDWQNDDRIVFEGGFEIHKQGRDVIETSLPRSIAPADLTVVTDLASDFITGFDALVTSTGALTSVFSSSTGDIIKVNATNDVLYIYDDMDGQEELVALVERASWADDFADTAQAYELRSSEDGSSFGYLFQTTEQNKKDLGGNSHIPVVTEAYNITLSKEHSDLPLEAWKYLNDTFPIPDSFGFDFYDISQVRVREEKMIYGGNQTVGEIIFLQFDLPGQNDAARIGYDITQNKFIAYGPDEWPDPNSSTYDADMTANASRATDVDPAVTQEVQQKISEIIDALFNGPSLDDDFYEAAVPDANYDITIDAIKLKAAQDDMHPDAAGSGPIVTPVLEASADGTDFTMTVSNGSSSHVVEVSSDITDFGTMLQAYASSATNNIVLEDLIYGLDDFVEDALDVNNAFGSSVAYSVQYDFNGESVITASMEDAEGFANWDSIVGGDDHDHGPEVLVITVANGKYEINGVVASDGFEFMPGQTYMFDVSGLSGHPFKLSTTADGTHGGGTAYDGNELITDPTSGEVLGIDVSSSTPPLFIYCENHPGMGGAVTIGTYTPPTGSGSGGSTQGTPPYDPTMDPNHDPMGDGPPAPEETFIMVEGTGSNAGTAYLYTPDDQISMTVTGIGDIATGLLADASSGATDMDIAVEMAIESTVMDFMIEDHDPYSDIT